MIAFSFWIEEILKIYSSINWEEEWLGFYEQHPFSKNILTSTIVKKEPLYCSNVSKHTELKNVFEKIPIKAFLAVPLLITDEVVGYLFLSSALIFSFKQNEIETLNQFVKQTGIAIQNVVSLNQEKNKANIDGLTGLNSWNYFNEEINYLINEAIKNGKPLSLIILEIDDFKKYQYSYGHLEGIDLLKKIGLIISKTIKDDGFVTRYSGEEFIVVLKDTTYEEAIIQAEQIQEKVKNIPRDDIKSQISISIGVASIPEHAKDSKTLLEYAIQHFTNKEINIIH